MRKGPAAEAERDASQHAVGGIARVSFFLMFIHLAIQASFFLLCLDQWTQHDQTNNFFFLETPGGRLLPYFCSEKRPGYVANAPGALFRNCFVEHPGERLLRSLRYLDSKHPDFELEGSARSVVQFEGLLPEASPCVAYAPVDLDGPVGVMVDISPRGIRTRSFGCATGRLPLR